MTEFGEVVNDKSARCQSYS